MFQTRMWLAVGLLVCAGARAQDSRPLPIEGRFVFPGWRCAALGGASPWAQGADAELFGAGRAVSFAQPEGDACSFELETLEFAPFDECLVSWNARHSKSTGFGVEIQVARSAEGPFSPWMWLGEWNVSERPADLVLAHEDARIDVDTFTSKSTWRALRLRTRVRTNDPASLRFSMERLSVMPTLRDASKKLKVSSGAVARLNVPFRSQRSEDESLAARICSPTSLAMVLEYRGIAVPTAEVARRAYDPFHDIYGNWNHAIQAAYSLGIPGYLVRFRDWSLALDMLRMGQPLIISIAAKPGQLRGAPYESTAGHLIVLCGLDEQGMVLVNDPAAGSQQAGQLAYFSEDLETVWLARGGTAYVLEAAKQR